MSKLLWFVALANTAGAIVLASVRYETPSADFWAAHPNWVMVAVVLTLAVPLTQAAVIEMGERRQRKELERENKVQTFLAASLIYLAHQANADWENTGIQAFVVAGRGRGKYQKRVAKFQLRAVATSGVRWTKGKGVIGRCWETVSRFMLMLAQWGPYAGYDREAWAALPAAERFGLTFEDYQNVKGKYGIIAAVPIVCAGDKYIGCVTADMPPHLIGGTPPVQQEILKSLALPTVNRRSQH